MLNLSTQEVVSSIENASLVNLNGILYQEYKNFFGKGRLGQLTDLDNLKLVRLERQENFPRQRVDYSENMMKQLKIFFMNTNITKALSRKFKTSLEFASVDIWQDWAGFILPPHTDDLRVKLALQIYLGDDNIGTSLFDSDKNCIKTFPFESNSGYALLNTKESLHGTEAKATKGPRKSLYVRYR